MKGNVKKVHIFRSVARDDQSISVTAKQDIGFCPFLTYLCLIHLDVAPTILDSLSKASKDGKLASLNILSFEVETSGSLIGKFSILFESKWPSLTCLNLKGCRLDENDIWSIVRCLVDPDNQKLPQLKSLIINLGGTINESEVVPSLSSTAWSIFYFVLERIQKLHIYNMDELVYQKFKSNLNRPNLQNLHQLVISFIKGDHSFVNIKTPVTNLPKLTELRLQRFVHSVRHLSTVAGSVTSSQLHKLNISHSLGITGNLSVLMRASLPFLTNLNLRNCGLNSNDLCSLAQASMDGKLPSSGI